MRDAPGVLASVAARIAERGVSVETVRQVAQDEGWAVLVLITHRASDEVLAATVAELATLEDVLQVRSVLRVEGH